MAHLGEGVALPHVRLKMSRRYILAIGRSRAFGDVMRDVHERADVLVERVVAHLKETGEAGLERAIAID